MNIEELSENLYDDLNGRILTVDYTDDLVIDFQCDDWNDPEVSRHFRIICHGVKETEILPCVSGEVEFTSSHQLLWSYNEQQGYLYYTSKPENRYELLGRIWEAHEKVLGGWRSLADFANTYDVGHAIAFCEGSNGLLARGPKPLMDIYKVAVDNYIHTNFVPSHTPEGGYKALVFDTCYVICKSVAVEEVYPS